MRFRRRGGHDAKSRRDEDNERRIETPPEQAWSGETPSFDVTAVEEGFQVVPSPPEGYGRLPEPTAVEDDLVPYRDGPPETTPLPSTPPDSVVTPLDEGGWPASDDRQWADGEWENAVGPPVAEGAGDGFERVVGMPADGDGHRQTNSTVGVETVGVETVGVGGASTSGAGPVEVAEQADEQWSTADGLGGTDGMAATYGAAVSAASAAAGVTSMTGERDVVPPGSPTEGPSDEADRSVITGSGRHVRGIDLPGAEELDAELQIEAGAFGDAPVLDEPGPGSELEAPEPTLTGQGPARAPDGGVVRQRDLGRDLVMGRPGPEGVRTLPRVLAVANQKGGVGKTTTTVNLGAALAELGYRVLVVDLDPQGNATTGLGIDARNFELSMYDVIMREVPMEDCIEPTSVKNLFVAPATIDLAGVEIELVPVFSRELRLRRAVDAVVDDFDFVLIDCPPSLGLITINGLAAASEVLVPIQCEYYALEGLSQLLRNVHLVASNLNEQLEVSTIVLTMYDGRTRLAVEVVSEVRQHFADRVCRTVIPRAVRLSEAPSFGQPITVFDPTSRGAIAYRELAEEVSDGAPKRFG